MQESYRDISNSVVEFGFDMPEYEEIKEDFYSAIVQGVKVSVINSKDDINKYLNEDTGELKLRTPFSIFVGGQVLDRGITIPNMVGFIIKLTSLTTLSEIAFAFAKKPIGKIRDEGFK